MSKSKETVFTCDGCGSAIPVPTEMDLPGWFAGTAWFTENGMRVKWHACSREHIEEAVDNAFGRAEAKDRGTDG